jgi:hypothetical protein
MLRVDGGRDARAPMDSTANQGPRGWYYRGYLPHFDGGEIHQSLTFRLADSFPMQRLEAGRWELRLLPPEQLNAELRRRIEDYLDLGRGMCHLRRPEIARVIEEAMLSFDDQRYHLLAWVVMPNHVHSVFLPLRGHTLSEIVQSWKSYTSKRANGILQRRRQF